MMRIEAFPRVHLTLIAMGPSGYRRNGGLGFALSEPRASVEGLVASAIRVEDRRKHGFAREESERLERRLLAVFQKLSLDIPVRFVIDGPMPTHYGFGSTTVLRLACLEILLALNGLGPNQEELVRLSGRGGTSGVGVETYFKGGFIFDAGHPGSSTPPRPSSQGEGGSSPPTTLVAVPMPQWQWGICIPFDVPALTEAQECEFFASEARLTPRQVNEILYHAVLGVSAAVLESDRRTFAQAINRLQDCAWKRREIDVFGDRVRDYAEILRSAGASAVAMSSLGPGMVFLAEDVRHVLATAGGQLSACHLACSYPRNVGRTVIRDDIS